MKRIKQMLRDLPIKDKLTRVFQLVTVAYVLLAAVALFQTLRSANYIGAVIILVIAISSVTFNYSVIKSLADMLVDLIKSLVDASQKIASGDFDIGVPYEANDELGELSDSFETAAGVLKKIVSDRLSIVEHFSDGNFDVHSSCPESYVGQLRNVLDELNEMVDTISNTMHGIQESSEQISAGSGQLAEGAQSVAEGATSQASATCLNELLEKFELRD